MFDQLALTVFCQFIVCGELALRVGDGVPVVLRGAAPEPAASIHVADSRTLWRIVIKPDLAIGEAYMQGRLHIDNDDLEAFMHLLIANSKHWEGHWAGRLSLFISDLFALSKSAARIETKCRTSLLSDGCFVCELSRPAAAIFLRLFFDGRHLA